MKQETMARKLVEMLGLQEQIDVEKEFGEPKKIKKNDKYVGVPEDEIQSAREAQAIYYFLQAPDLFTPKTCRHCSASFLVSRQFVALCSYTCMEKELEQLGVKWSRKYEAEQFGEDPFKVIAETVYEGNEPLWIRHIDTIRSLIDKNLRRMQMPNEIEINNWFGYHRATEESAPKHNSIRQSFLSQALWLNEFLPDGRDKSLVLTKLQEAMHWANSAIAMQNDVDTETPHLPNA